MNEYFRKAKAKKAVPYPPSPFFTSSSCYHRLPRTRVHHHQGGQSKKAEVESLYIPLQSATKRLYINWLISSWLYIVQLATLSVPSLSLRIIDWCMSSLSRIKGLFKKKKKPQREIEDYTFIIELKKVRFKEKKFYIGTSLVNIDEVSSTASTLSCFVYTHIELIIFCNNKTYPFKV